jgi:hypothetical protein
MTISDFVPRRNLLQVCISSADFKRGWARIPNRWRRATDPHSGICCPPGVNKFSGFTFAGFGKPFRRQ